MIRHVVMFQFREATTDVDVDDYERRLLEYVATLDGVLSYVPARDAGVNPGTFDYAIVAEFVDEVAFRAYFDGETHRQIQRDTADMITAKASSQNRLAT